MKNFLTKICGALLLLLLIAGLAACNGEGDGMGDMDWNGSPPVTAQPSETPPPANTTPPPPPPAETPAPTPADTPPPRTPARLPATEDLMATLMGAMEFWDSWWNRTGAFALEHIGEYVSNFQPFDENIAPAHHPISRGFSPLLPSSGFTSLDDIAEYLLQFYTQEWVDSGEFAEPSVLASVMGETVQRFGGFNAFEEYDGNLYVFTWNENLPRPDWERATIRSSQRSSDSAFFHIEVPIAANNFAQWNTERNFFHMGMPTAPYDIVTYFISFTDGRLSRASGTWSPPLPQMWQRFSVPLEDSRLFIYRSWEARLLTFDTSHPLGLPNFGASAMPISNEGILISSLQTLRNISLVVLESVFDDVLNEDRLIVTHESSIVDVVHRGRISVRGYVSDGALPWSGITFTTEAGNQHYFAIFYDSSDSPYRFVLVDVTGQMLEG